MPDFVGIPESTGEKSVVASAVLLLFLFFIEPSWAAKTDLLILRNGNNITGEIKQLRFGKLRYSTDDIGTISVDWDKVVFLKSIHIYEVETEKGDTYFGTVDTDTTLHNIVLMTEAGEVSLPFLEVVRIVPIKSTFWTRMDGSWVSVGFIPPTLALLGAGRICCARSFGRALLLPRPTPR